MSGPEMRASADANAVRAALARATLMVGAVCLLGFYFAMVEIQIEGASGWAAALPTWRIEKHWLLDIVWGGRALTGYHAWIFSFMILVFHLPFAMFARWSFKLEARAIGGVLLFWIIEDFAWFLANPDYGWSHFDPRHVPWHKHWVLGLPTDYYTFTAVGAAALAYSFWGVRPEKIED